MIEKLSYNTLGKEISLNISEDHKRLAIFLNDNKIGEFGIEEVWDMVRDAVATVDAGRFTSPGLFRRKGESAASIIYTNKLLMNMKG